MPVRFRNHIVEQRLLDCKNAVQAHAKYGGILDDYADGDWPIGSRRDPISGVITPPETTIEERRRRLAAAIIVERDRRAGAAALEISTTESLKARLALDANIRGALEAFQRHWIEGSVRGRYLVHTNYGEVVLIAGQMRLVANAADEYFVTLNEAASRRQVDLVSTADARLDSFDVSADWPALIIPVDISNPPDPRGPLEDRLTTLETDTESIISLGDSDD